MSNQFDRIIAALEQPMREGRIGRIRRGIEKEGLRVDPQGQVSQKPHPKSLGSKLTHPYITTDYSEALLEYVTPVFCRPRAALEFLTDLHRFTYHYLGNEFVWPTSMPSILNGNQSVPIADFGSSNSGRMKHVYRCGLDVRYGRIMQAIAGIHYNVSMPDNLWHELAVIDGSEGLPLRDIRSEGYFRLIRNFRRHSWLLMYLFGASPVIDRSFLDGREVAGFDHVGQHSLISRYASSLRMSDLGYQNKVQNQLKVSYDSLSNYVKTLRHAVSTPWPDYERYGIEQADGEWQQLNANILQIENEFYSDIRPKRVARNHQTPTQALEAEGVEYIEVRCLDINPLLAVGIDETEMRCIDVFLLFCLLDSNDSIGEEENQHILANRTKVVSQGRDPRLTLHMNGQDVTLREAGEQLFSQMNRVAELLDFMEEGTPNVQALQELAPRLANPALTPAGQIHAALTSRDEDYVDWTLARAKQQAEMFMSTAMDSAREDQLEQLAASSHTEQMEMEQNDHLSFADYVARYFAHAEVIAKPQ